MNYRDIKSIFVILFIFNSSVFFAQTKTTNEKPVKLEEVIVSKKKKPKTSLKIIKLDGFPMYNGINNQSKIVSLVKDIPSGKLKFVRFYFNTGLINLFKKKLEIKYKDVELGLLIYEVGANGLPGKVISENEIIFTVNKDDHGEFNINVRKLNLEYDKLFIGFSVLTELNGTENNLYVRYNEKKDAKTFVIAKKGKQWIDYSHGFPFHFKLKVGIEQYSE